jgi:DNA-binding MarR family transcriptional regulator
MGKGINEERMAAWMALLQTHATVVGGLEEALLAQRNLPLPWFEVLVQLTAQPDGRLPMQELARSVLLSKSGVTRLVDRMADAGLVLRGACESDRRVVYATVTDRGRALLTEAMPVFVDGFERSFSRHLSAADAKALRGLLLQVLAGNGDRAAPECPSSYLSMGPARAPASR